jgi:hypothetical protein
MQLSAVDQVLSDADMITMAQRRIADGDVGYTWEYNEKRRYSQNAETKNMAAQIIARGTKNAESAYPIRFKIFAKSESLNEQLLPTIIVDAWFKKDEFGTWNMAWKFNADQSLAVRADQQKVLDKLGKSGIDIDLANSMQEVLKQVFGAQVQFQSGAHEDVNNNRIGEFANDLDILCGVRETKKGEKLSYLSRKLFDSLASSNVQYKCFGDSEREFYVFMKSPLTGEVFLLSHDGRPIKISEREMPKSLVEARAIEEKKKK